MIEVVFGVCLFAGRINETTYQVRSCHEIHLTFEGEIASVTPMQCFLNGQPEIANWTVQHPRWLLDGRGFRCGAAGVYSRI